MRLLILSDIHANWEALLSLQRAEPKPDAVLFAGDAVGYGPDPANCVRWLRAQATACVRGDCDEAAITGEGLCECEALNEAAHSTLALARTQIAPADAAALSLWPLTETIRLGGATFVIAHATPAHPLDGEADLLMGSDSELLEALGEHHAHADFIVLGHTHLPALRRVYAKLFINPGSLGQPRYGLPDATYAIWDDGQVQIKHLHYDHDATAQRLRLEHLNPEVAEQLTEILEKGIVE